MTFLNKNTFTVTTAAFCSHYNQHADIILKLFIFPYPEYFNSKYRFRITASFWHLQEPLSRNVSDFFF